METLLIAEDEPISRAILAAQLTQAGYHVETVEDGMAAWTRLSTTDEALPEIALLVTDRRMPGLDGLELFARMQQNLALSVIPVIMQTSANAPEEVVEGIKSGVYYYLTKPYLEETLLTLVKTAIRERRQKERFESRLIRQRQALGRFVRGEFEFRGLREAQNIAFLLGSLFPRPELAVPGLYELMLNAVEHGNLAIGFEEKSRLLAASGLEEEIRRRLSAPEYIGRRVQVDFAQDAAEMRVTITDEGSGFDWRPYLEIEPGRATRAHGRGIAKANLLSFDHLRYEGRGNRVQVAARLDAKTG